MAGTSHFADAMRHPRTQVAFAQFAISPSRWRRAPRPAGPYRPGSVHQYRDITGVIYRPL